MDATPEGLAALEMIADEPSEVVIGGRSYRAYLSRPVTQDLGDGSSEVRRTVVVAADPGDIGDTVGAGGLAWMIESVEDLGGAVNLEVIRE